MKKLAALKNSKDPNDVAWYAQARVELTKDWKALKETPNVDVDKMLAGRNIDISDLDEGCLTTCQWISLIAIICVIVGAIAYFVFVVKADNNPDDDDDTDSDIDDVVVVAEAEAKW